MNYSKLRQLQKMNKISNREISVVVGLTDTGYGKMLENETCTVSTLEKIANYFKVPVSYFFDEQKPLTYAENERSNVANEPCPFCEVLKAKNEGLEALLEAKNETIAALRGDAKKEKPLNRTA